MVVFMLAEVIKEVIVVTMKKSRLWESNFEDGQTFFGSHGHLPKC